jgi:hypothetical protein
MNFLGQLAGHFGPQVLGALGINLPGVIPQTPPAEQGGMNMGNMLQNANSAIGLAGGIKSLMGGGQAPPGQLPGMMPPMTIGQLASNYGQQNQGPRY